MRAAHPAGPDDADFVLPRARDRLGYPGRKLDEVSLDQYIIILYRWFKAAGGTARYVYCGKPIRDAKDLPDAKTFDAILVEMELLAQIVLHFDYKRWISKKLTGMHPFELRPCRLTERQL